MLMLECPGCGRKFPWAPNKKFHSYECRKRHDEKVRQDSDDELWSSTVEVEYPDEIKEKDVTLRIEKIMEGYAKTGVAFYRLGCPRNNPSPPFVLRWFPSRGKGVRAFLAINDLPRDIPLPCLYLVAFFDSAKVLMYKPDFKLPVPGFDPTLRWSSGTQKP